MKARKRCEIKSSPGRAILGGLRPTRVPGAVSIAAWDGCDLVLNADGGITIIGGDSEKRDWLERLIARYPGDVREYLSPWTCEGCGTTLSVPEHFCSACDAAARLLGAVAVQGSGMPHLVGGDSRTICKGVRVTTTTPAEWPQALCKLCRLAIQSVRDGQAA